MSDLDNVSNNALDIDSNAYMDAELASAPDERGRATMFVQLPDGTEDSFFTNEKNMRQANYFLNTPVGTKMKVQLRRDETTHRIYIWRIKRNPNTSPRVDARTLPWLKAIVPFDVNFDKPYYFITVQDSCEFFKGPSDVHVTSRLIRNSGYEDGLKENQELFVRVVVGETGLSVAAIKYPDGYVNNSLSSLSQI